MTPEDYAGFLGVVRMAVAIRRRSRAPDGLRAERVNRGLCPDCGDPAQADRLRCRVCLDVKAAWQLDHYRARTGAQPRAMKCALCNQPGHDRRRCKETTP